MSQPVLVTALFVVTTSCFTTGANAQQRSSLQVVPSQYEIQFESVGGSHADSDEMFGGSVMPHSVIRSPRPQLDDQENSLRTRRSQKHPPLLRHRGHGQAESTTIPDSFEQPVWKAPYSYGHFGASGKRHWLRDHGYRDRYTQWTLR